MFVNYLVNVQSFIDDPDSLRRKRQKFNNSPNALILRHVQAEAEKHAAMLNRPFEYNFNIVKPEPMEAMSPYGGNIASGGAFPSYPMGTNFPQPSSNMQTLRPKLSPGRTPSPMEYSPYNPGLVQPQLSPQYQPSGGHVVQQPPPMGEQFVYIQNTLPAQPQEQLLLDSVTPYNNNYTLNNAVADGTGVTSVLDMDSQQYSFDLNQLDSAELAVLGTALSENLSAGLSISDSTKTETNKGAQDANAGPDNFAGSNSMTDSFTRITNNTIQELCNLNDMYKSTREVD